MKNRIQIREETERKVTHLISVFLFISRAVFKPCETSQMKRLAEIVNSFLPLITFSKSSIQMFDGVLNKPLDSQML